MENTTILIVDDEARMRKLIKDFLAKNDYKTLEACDGEEAIEVFEENKNKISLILLDVMMPKLDGWSVLRKIRNESQIPVIMLTAKGEVFDKVLALELGADDYMVKPFDPKELLARVKAVTRRYAVDNQSKDVIKYSDLTIDIGAYEVTYKGKNVKLAPKELELLHFMANNPNKVFTREQLMYEVWGYDYPGDSRTVDVHIKRLREKVKGGDEWELQTVWGVGYKFEVR